MLLIVACMSHEFRRAIGIDEGYGCGVDAAGAFNEIDQLRGSDSWRS